MAVEFRCDNCGRAVAYADLDSGRAIHRLITPDTSFTSETWLMECAACREKGRRISRAEWSEAHDKCMVCGWTWGRQTMDDRCRLETHEIARGPARQAALKEPAAWLRVCNMCHEDMDSLRLWTIARQLAIKKLQDFSHYDRVKVNELRGRAPNAITEEEVDECL